VYAEPLPRHGSPNAYTPIVFYSEDVHYSVVKAVRLLELRTFYQEGMARYPGQSPINDGQWPEEVPSHDFDRDDPLSGSIKVDDLETLVRFFVERGYPVLVVANLGTTWKGAYDDVEAIDRMFVRLGQEFSWLWEREVPYQGGHHDVRRGFWLHVDGALGAAYLPFIEMATMARRAGRGPRAEPGRHCPPRPERAPRPGAATQPPICSRNSLASA
jgi:histidine decarboxylase